MRRNSILQSFLFLLAHRSFPFFSLRLGLFPLPFLFLIFLLFFFPQTPFFALSDISPLRKVPKKKSRPCCTLGIAYESGPGKVLLEQICMRPKVSVFHFRLKNLPATCTYPQATILKDQKGRRYRMLRHTGLPDCSSRKLQMKANISFTWIFERLKPNTRRITLIEALDPVTQGMGHWYWRDISLGHCKFD